MTRETKAGNASAHMNAGIYQCGQRRGDEITLIHLWLILQRRKYSFWLVFLIVTIATAFYVGLRSHDYVYSSAVQLGKIMNANGSMSSITRPTSAVAILQAATIPKTLNGYANVHRSKGLQIANLPTIEVSKKGYIITLRSIAPRRDKAVIFMIQNMVLNKFVNDEATLTAPLYRYLKQRKRSLQTFLQATKGQLKHVLNQLSQITGTRSKVNKHFSATANAHNVLISQIISAEQQQLTLFYSTIQRASGDLANINERILRFQPTQIIQPPTIFGSRNASTSSVVLAGLAIAFLAGLTAAFVAELIFGASYTENSDALSPSNTSHGQSR